MVQISEALVGTSTSWTKSRRSAVLSLPLTSIATAWAPGTRADCIVWYRSWLPPRHVPQVVAMKKSTTTWPRWPARWNDDLPRAGRVKSGATCLVYAPTGAGGVLLVVLLVGPVVPALPVP